MKIFALLITLVSYCLISGCSTNSASPETEAKDDTVLKGSTNVSKPTASPSHATDDTLEGNPGLDKLAENYSRICNMADLLLKTENWWDFEESKPVRATANRDTLGKLLRDKKLPGHGVAVVVFPQERLPAAPGKVEPSNEEILANVRQVLKNAGFTQVYFFTRMYGTMMTPIP